MRRGPAPTPTAILEARGSWLAKTRAAEPQATGVMGDPPAWLNDSAQEVWRQISEQLADMGVGRLPDANALARYCHGFVRWRQAAVFVDKHGETYPLKDKNGELRCFMPWPQVAVLNQMSVVLLRLEQEFGLTPSARTRIEVDIPAAPDTAGKGRFFAKVAG